MKTLDVRSLYAGLGRDIWRGLVVVVAIEVIRHYLKPKDRAIEAVDAVAGLPAPDSWEY